MIKIEILNKSNQTGTYLKCEVVFLSSPKTLIANQSFCHGHSIYSVLIFSFKLNSILHGPLSSLKKKDPVPLITETW